MSMMSSIEFVIATDELDDAVSEDCAEPIIDGLSLVDAVKRAERRPIMWAGLRPAELFEQLRGASQFGRQVGERVALLRCACGHRDCSELTAVVKQSGDTMVWESFKAPRFPDETYAQVGPFTFPRADYQAALDHPRHARSPDRDVRVLQALADGEPEDPNEWLQSAYVEADWPADGDHLAALLDGLRARRRSGNPIGEAEAYRWARDLGFHEGTCGTVVGLVRAANAPGSPPIADS
jgi:hypothetical protein